MASGKTHNVVNLLVFPPVVYYLQPVEFVSFSAGYIAGTFFLSPDNDIYHSSQNRRWKIFRFIWYPYTKMFKHRGVSHIPFYGMFTKLLYLSAVFIGLIFLIDRSLKLTVGQELLKFDVNSDILHLFTEHHILSFLSGLFLSEIVHIFTDGLYSIIKPKKRKKAR